jgi:hypothetical protein
MELIVKNGTVRIPSIFMFEDYEGITIFLGRAEEAGCTVIFENEGMVISPRGTSTEVRTKLHIYSHMVGNREIGNAYLRYLGGIEKMTWDNAQGE